MNFYFGACGVLDALDRRAGSVKSCIAAAAAAEPDRKRTAALVLETLKYKPVLAHIIAASHLLETERQLAPNLALLLVHDLLLATPSGIQAGDGPIKQAILRHKTRLNAELTILKLKRGVRSVTDLAVRDDDRASAIPRYVRVNTLVCAADDAVNEFTSRGFVLKDAVDLALSTSKSHFSIDPHVPNLLVFNPTASISWTDDPLYRQGKLILQDKASCFPAIVLDPPSSENPLPRVIDATSAPGNKTTHLSALMRGQGKLFAFERDRKRFKTLTTMLEKARCTNVVPINADFLATNPNDPRFTLVTHILLDPSCSGSGIVNRLDYLLAPPSGSEEQDKGDGDNDEENRLAKLAAFQLAMLRHAMKFPSVQRIVYSTCSVHAIEDEHVVRAALSSPEAQPSPTRTGFVLAPRDAVLPAWPRRGRADEMEGIPDQAESLVRCLPGEDATNGFFVSCFVRRPAVPSSSAHRVSHNSGTTTTKARQHSNNAQKQSPSVAVDTDKEEQEEDGDTDGEGGQQRSSASTKKRKKKRKPKKMKKRRVADGEA